MVELHTPPRRYADACSVQGHRIIIFSPRRAIRDSGRARCCGACACGRLQQHCSSVKPLMIFWEAPRSPQESSKSVSSTASAAPAARPGERHKSHAHHAWHRLQLHVYMTW